MSSGKLITVILITLKVACIIGQKKYADIYYLKNHVLGLSEEMLIDALEEDNSFTGGKGVKHWLKLSSGSVLYLIGVKEAGLSLITITKKQNSPFYEAVESQIDIGENITAAIAFRSFNAQQKRIDDLILTSTASVTNDIILYKIQNFKLVEFWSWRRYTKVQTVVHFTVVREDRLFILDSNGITGYLYKFTVDNDSVHIRELEVLNFSEKVLKIFVSVSFPEPYLYAIQNGTLVIYRYSRYCPGTWAGEFIKQTSIENLGVTEVIPFQSNGIECLAVAGKSGGILRIDASEKVVQDLEIENVDEWLIVYTGPDKAHTLLFCKTLEGDIKIFYNTGFGWKSHNNPSCYKHDQDNKRIETESNLGCIKKKKWFGAVSLELGQLPTVVFSDRTFIGEMFHIMIDFKRHVISMDEVPENESDHWSYLSKFKYNLKSFVNGMSSKKEADSTCSIVGMLKEIEKIAAHAKEKVSSSCPNKGNPMISSSRIISDSGSGASKEYNVSENQSKEEDAEYININSITSEDNFPHAHMISPDMVEPRSSPLQKKILPSLSMTGFSKKQEDII